MSTVPEQIELVDNASPTETLISSTTDYFDLPDQSDLSNHDISFDTSTATNQTAPVRFVIRFRISPRSDDESLIQPPEQPPQQLPQQPEAPNPLQPPQADSNANSLNFEYRLFSIILCLLEIIAIAIVLGLEWKKGCDRDGLLGFLISRAVSNAALILLHLPSLYDNSGVYIPKLRKLVRFSQYLLLIYAIVELTEVNSCRRSITILTIVLGSLSIAVPAFVAAFCIITCGICIILIPFGNSRERILDWFDRVLSGPDAPETEERRSRRLEKVNELLASNTIPWEPTLPEGEFSPDIQCCSCCIPCCSCCFCGKDEENTNLLPESQGSCIVCQEEFVYGSSVVRLPECGHIFDQDCIKPWLKEHNTCPVCRAQVV